MKYPAFILTQAKRNFGQSWGIQSMTLLTVTLSVLIFSFFYLVYANMLEAGARLGGELRLIVYLDGELNPEQQALFRQKVTAFAGAEKIDFIPPARAFDRLTRQLGEDRDILTDLTPAFLPFSVEIHPDKKLKTLAEIKQLADYLKNLPGVTKVQYGHGWVERFGYFVTLLRFVVISSGTLLILTTVFMVSYTLRLTLHARQQELKVLRYLGATNWYIQGPVMLEGFLLGILGAGLGLGALHLLFRWFKNHFSGPDFMNVFQFTFFSAGQTAAIFLVSILLCTLGSIMSIRKLLKI